MHAPKARRALAHVVVCRREREEQRPSLRAAAGRTVRDAGGKERAVAPALALIAPEHAGGWLAATERSSARDEKALTASRP